MTEERRESLYSVLHGCATLMIGVVAAVNYTALTRAEATIREMSDERKQHREQLAKHETKVICLENFSKELLRDVVEDWEHYPNYATTPKFDIIDNYRVLLWKPGHSLKRPAWKRPEPE